MQYGGDVLAVGDIYQNMAVNRHITGTAHQGGNFTAGKIPTTTLKKTKVTITCLKRNTVDIKTQSTCVHMRFKHSVKNSDPNSKKLSEVSQ